MERRFSVLGATSPPCGRGRIASSDAIRVRGYALTIDLNPSPQPSPPVGEGWGEGFRSIVRAYPLTRIASDDAIRPLPQGGEVAPSTLNRRSILLYWTRYSDSGAVAASSQTLVASSTCGRTAWR